MPEKGVQKNNRDLVEVVLTNNVEILEGVHVISFERIFNFLPGQVVKIAIDNNHPPRIYSICSGNNEDEINILFNLKEDGYLTPKLAGMVPGEKILVSKPYGSFIGGEGSAWWISTGTGIAPFYSMLKSGQAANKKLLHGVSYLNQFYFEDELEWALDDNYVRCCSRQSACNVFQGRVTDYLKTILPPPKTKYYLCGKANMVVDVRDLLIEKGVAYGNILSEIYF